MGKAMKEIARDVEYGLLRNTTATEGDASTAGQFGGIPYFNATNVVDMAGVALTEEALNDAIQKAWEAGGNPETAIVPGRLKRVISGFTANGNKNFDQGEKKLVNVIDVYESDFGLIKVQAHRLQKGDADTARIDIIESQYWKLAYLIPFKTKDLPQDSLKTASVITGQLTMECRTKDAHAAIINIK